MKTLTVLLTLAFTASAFSQQWGMSQVELGRQYDRDQQMDVIRVRQDDLERQFRQQ